jgi:hypothetical protein
VACHFFETLPAPDVLGNVGANPGKFPERLAAFEAAKSRMQATPV